jgi:hypothetical protein
MIIYCCFRRSIVSSKKKITGIGKIKLPSINQKSRGADIKLGGQTHKIMNASIADNALITLTWIMHESGTESEVCGLG